MHSVYETVPTVLIFPSTSLLLVWGKEQSYQILHLLSFLTSRCLLCRSLSFPYSHHTFRGSTVFHHTPNTGSAQQSEPWEVAFPVSSWSEPAHLLLCASAPLWLLLQGPVEAQGRCVSLWVHGCCCKGGYERQTVRNSSGYCRPPQGSMNRASRRQLIHAVLWSMQKSQPLSFISAKFTQKCFFLNPPQAIKLWSRLISCHISFLKSELACADTRETYNIFHSYLTASDFSHCLELSVCS